jgi:hypothetical protein
MVKTTFGMRYEDLLAHPFDEMQKLWKFLGAQAIDPAGKVDRGRNVIQSR